MGRYDLDFSETEQQSPIRPGKYDVVIDNIEIRQSETGEFPYLNWKTTIVGGEFEGRTVYLITSLSPKALWNLQKTFTSYGIEAQKVPLEFSDDEPRYLTSPSLDGQPGVATVFNEKYNGRVNSKISDLVGPGGVPEETPVPAAKAPAANAQKEKVNPFAGKRSFK